MTYPTLKVTYLSKGAKIWAQVGNNFRAYLTEHPYIFLSIKGHRLKYTSFYLFFISVSFLVIKYLWKKIPFLLHSTYTLHAHLLSLTSKYQCSSNLQPRLLPNPHHSNFFQKVPPLSLLIFSLCVCTHLHRCVHHDEHVEFIRKTNSAVGPCLLPLGALFTVCRTLAGPGAPGILASASPLTAAVQGLDTLYCTGLYVGSADQNSGLRAVISSALLTESTPHHLLNLHF